MQTVKVKIYNLDYEPYASSDYASEESVQPEYLLLTYTKVASFQFGGEYFQMIFEDGSSKILKGPIEVDIVPTEAAPTTE